jgi:hypothetical protein
MGIDKAEISRRSQSPRKAAKNHPYAAIEHRVIDSAAYANLSFSAQALLVLLARQISKEGNNGHLQACFKWCQPRGFGSEHTLRHSIAELIEHGLIYRTRSHGANGAWARYALTWLSIKNRHGLFLDGFKPNAWRDWQLPEKKAPSKKCRTNPAKSAVSPINIRQKVPEQGGQKMPPMNLVASTRSETARLAPLPDLTAHEPGGWMHGYLVRLTARGLGDFCPVAALH